MPYQEYVTPKGSTMKASSLNQKQRTDSKIKAYNSFASNKEDELNITNGNSTNLMTHHSKGSPYFSSQPSKTNLHNNGMSTISASTSTNKKQTNSDRDIPVQ